MLNPSDRPESSREPLQLAFHAGTKAADNAFPVLPCRVGAHVRVLGPAHGSSEAVKLLILVACSLADTRVEAWVGYLVAAPMSRMQTDQRGRATGGRWWCGRHQDVPIKTLARRRPKKKRPINSLAAAILNLSGPTVPCLSLAHAAGSCHCDCGFHVISTCTRRVVKLEGSAEAKRETPFDRAS